VVVAPAGSATWFEALEHTSPKLAPGSVGWVSSFVVLSIVVLSIGVAVPCVDHMNNR
jgi:hypothetical protein